MHGCARVCHEPVHRQAGVAGDSWMLRSRVLVHQEASGSGCPSLLAFRVCVSYIGSPKPRQPAGSSLPCPVLMLGTHTGFPGRMGVRASLGRDACRPWAGAAGLEMGAQEGNPLAGEPCFGVGRVHEAQAASRDMREEYGRAVPCAVACADLFHLCQQQPVPESTQRPRAGTMEAPSRTPASPTCRVQTIIQVSTWGCGTPTLQDTLRETLREPGQPDGSPGPPQPPHPDPIMGSVAKPIALSGWQLGSS